jgi:hypothetical protein
VQPEAQRLEHVLQRQPLLGRRSLVHAVQRGVLGAGDEVRRADVGRQHRLLDQLVRLGAHARHDLLDAAAVVADDLRLHGLEVDRAAQRALLEQRPVDLVQVQQVRHQRGAPLRLGAARVGQHGGHLGVGQPRVRADDGREELVGVHRPVAADDHVADHRQPVLLGFSEHSRWTASRAASG